MLRLVAHELRAHLTVLDGYAELLCEPAVRADGARVDRALAVIRDHVSSLRDMAAHLAVAVHEGEAELRPRPQWFALRTSAAEAAAMAGESAAARHCSLVVEDAALATDDAVEADRFQMVTAMRNLLDNACRHGPYGGRVRLVVEPHGDEVEVRVHDAGPGVGGLAAAAFRPFVHERSPTSPATGGLGLGLSLVADVARLHGGTVFWGRDEQGSMVGFVIPRQARAHGRGGEAGLAARS